MEIPSLGCKKRTTLVILGAGATRGASFVEVDDPLQPPLDGDFFRVLQVSSTGRSDKGRSLLEHVRTVYGPALNVGLETVFNNLDAAQTFHSAFNVTRGRHLQVPARLIEALNNVVPGLLGETVSDDCAYHTALAQRLQVGDAVISLNYDCVIDFALARYAGRRFDPLKGGYGIEVSPTGVKNWRTTRGRGRRSEGSVLLLKLHGSLNWRSGNIPLRLRRDPYAPVRAGVIAPPLTNKPVTSEPFASIWKAARRSVSRMRRLIIIGYSLPQADGLVRTLLATDLSTTLEEILIADPHQRTVERHVDFFARLAPKARVFTFASMRQVATALEAS